MYLWRSGLEGKYLINGYFKILNIQSVYFVCLGCKQGEKGGFQAGGSAGGDEVRTGL